MATLTDQQKAWYLAHSGARCPYCHSENIEAQEQVQFDADEGYQHVRCSECKATWVDILALVAVEADED